MKYVHTNIISKDWRKLADFYIQTFDCRIIPPLRDQSGKWLEQGTGVKNAALKGAHLLLPGYSDKGPTLEIYQYEDIEDSGRMNSNHRRFGHIAFEVGNVKEVLQQLLDNGGEKLGEVVTREIEGVGELSFVYARDPDGNIIELQSWKKE